MTIEHTPQTDAARLALLDATLQFERTPGAINWMKLLEAMAEYQDARYGHDQAIDKNDELSPEMMRASITVGDVEDAQGDN
jgi:hypothetical protein